MEPDDVAAGLYGRIFAIAAGVGRKRLGGEDFEGDGIATRVKGERVNWPVNSVCFLGLGEFLRGHAG